MSNFCLFTEVMSTRVDEAKVDVESLDVDEIVPDKKDIERAEGLQMFRGSFFGNGAPKESAAKVMAASIKDVVKLIRRAKAVVNMWGTEDLIGYSGGARGEPQAHPQNVWEPFKNALKKAGVSTKDIDKISKYKK